MKKLSPPIRIALIFCLVGALVGAPVGYVIAQSNSTFVVSAGKYPSAGYYTVWREGTHYYAKNSNGEIDFSSTNATTLFNNVFYAAPVGAQINVKIGHYYVDGIIAPRQEQNIIGESRGKYNDFTLSTIIELTEADATIYLKGIEGVRLSHLYILGDGVAKGITLGDDGGASASYIFTDLSITNCTYGVYNDVTTTGFYDSVFYSCIFLYNDVGVQLKELMNQFYQCSFRLNEIAVDYSYSTTGFWPKFDGCVFSSNDYDFNLGTNNGAALTCVGCWFEREGEYTLGLGSGDVFTYTAPLNVGTNGLVFERCYFSEYSNIDVSWVDPATHEMNKVVFRECNFQGWDNLTMLSLPTEHYPKFDDSWRHDTGGGVTWLNYENSGREEVTGNLWVEHELFTTPTSIVTTSNDFSTYIADLNATHFRVYVVCWNGSVSGTTQYVWWHVIYNP